MILEEYENEFNKTLGEDGEKNQDQNNGDVDHTSSVFESKSTLEKNLLSNSDEISIIPDGFIHKPKKKFNILIFLQKLKFIFTSKKIKKIVLLKIPINFKSYVSINDEDTKRIQNQFETVGFKLKYHQVPFNSGHLILTLQLTDHNKLITKFELNKNGNIIEQLEKYDHRKHFGNVLMYHYILGTAGWITDEELENLKEIKFESIIYRYYYFGWQSLVWLTLRIALVCTYYFQTCFYYAFSTYSYTTFMLTLCQFGFTHSIYVELLNILGSFINWLFNRVLQIVNMDKNNTTQESMMKLMRITETSFKSLAPRFLLPGDNNDASLKRYWLFLDWMIIFGLCIISYKSKELATNFIFEFINFIAMQMGIITYE